MLATAAAAAALLLAGPSEAATASAPARAAAPPLGAASAPAPARAAAPPLDADAALTVEAGALPGGAIASHFVGFSIEWSLIERYMGPAARPAFAKLLRNLGTGELRIGGSSQDLMPFDPVAADTNRVVTPTDLNAIRTTLDAVNAGDPGDAVPSWGTILGTTLAPPDPERPWAGPEHARAFTTQGVVPAFAGGAERYVAGIGLGNEPDISYDYDLPRYLADLIAYRDGSVTRPYPLVAPSTSEPVARWQRIQEQSQETRFFWDWPAILDTIAPAMKAVRGAFGVLATDHFYPLARGCANDEYRCASIERLLSDERLANLAYEVHTHSRETAARGLDYRLQEVNTAAGRGVDGVSNVAASALWALMMMFEAACPQPPDAPGDNANCAAGAIGVNLHNAEVQEFFEPEQGNAFYNAVRYDPTPTAGAPTVGPTYYALLLFSHFAHGTTGLRPLAVAAAPGAAEPLRAWQVQSGPSERRLFVVNRSPRAQIVSVAAPGTTYEIDRMTPHDPSGAGRRLDAPEVRIDGRSVAADGSWPGFATSPGRLVRGRLRISLGAGEAAVVTLPGR